MSKPKQYWILTIVKRYESLSGETWDYQTHVTDTPPGEYLLHLDPNMARHALIFALETDKATYSALRGEWFDNG